MAIIDHIVHGDRDPDRLEKVFKSVWPIFRDFCMSSEQGSVNNPGQKNENDHRL